MVFSLRVWCVKEFVNRGSKEIQTDAHEGTLGLQAILGLSYALSDQWQCNLDYRLLGPSHDSRFANNVVLKTRLQTINLRFNYVF